MEAAGRRSVLGGRLLDVPQDGRGERLVEAHEQGPKALPGEAERLLDRDDRLAAAGWPDDLRSADVPSEVERPALFLGCLDQALAVVVDIVPEQAAEGDCRGEVVVDAANPVGPEALAAAAIADPVGEGAIHGGSSGCGCCECVGVEDDLRRRIRAEEGMAPRKASQVDVGEGHRVADPRLALGGPVRQVGQGAPEVVLRRLGLRERRPLQALGPEPPGPGRVAARLTGLDLDHEETVLGMDDDQICLAVVGRPVATRLRAPADALVDRALGQKCRPKDVVDAALRSLASRLDDPLSQPLRSPAPASFVAYGTGIVGVSWSSPPRSASGAADHRRRVARTSWRWYSSTAARPPRSPASCSARLPTIAQTTASAEFETHGAAIRHPIVDPEILQGPDVRATVERDTEGLRATGRSRARSRRLGSGTPGGSGYADR